MALSFARLLTILLPLALAKINPTLSGDTDRLVTVMTNREFGKLVRDMMWDDEPERTFLVYADGFYIEELEDGRHNLLIGNEETTTSETISLSDLEKRLFDYAQSECYPEWQRREPDFSVEVSP